MLSEGYSFNELLGKENKLTEELRFVETVVGPVQSIYLGYFKKDDSDTLTDHINFDISENVLDDCLTEIEAILEKWEDLPVGSNLNLEWIVR